MSRLVVEIHLKGTTSFRFETTRFKLAENPITGGITKLEWDKIAGERQLLFVDVDDVRAVLIEPPVSEKSTTEVIDG